MTAKVDNSFTFYLPNHHKLKKKKERERESEGKEGNGQKRPKEP